MLLVLHTNIRLGQEDLPGAKYSSLLGTFLNYVRNKFYNIDPRILIFLKGFWKAPRQSA